MSYGRSESSNAYEYRVAKAKDCKGVRSGLARQLDVNTFATTTNIGTIDTENDAIRQAHPIAQAINALTEFVESVPGLSESVSSNFVSSNSFSNLMNMDEKVKAAAFNLLKVFLKAKPDCINGTRIPSFILKELDSKDTLLCRNAFECFLLAANDPSFYQTVKIEKAVVPKFVTLVRRKHLHWNVLESSLLPSVSIIYDNLPDEEQKKKWLSTILECFFDGTDEGLLLVPWIKSFSEVFRFAYLKAATELSDFLSQTFFKFLDVVIPFDDGQTTSVVVDLILWIDQKLVNNYDASDAFKEKLTASLAKGLPRATKVFEAFFEYSEDQNR
uniref:E3 ubiquitin-protein ligase listerin n=2 Tax=Panagrellus redivivus TaxID=6233 RepID=A0A7E4ZR64_PANRE